MRLSTLVFGIAVALGGSALAQYSDVRAGATSETNTSVSASHDGAAATHDSNTTIGATSGPRRAGIAQGTELRATLTTPVDARRAKPGDEVTATLSQNAQASGQVVLYSGAKLVGHVTEAQARGKRADAATASNDSRLGIMFYKAVLVTGREVPVNATIQALAVEEPEASGRGRDVENAAGRLVSGSRGVFGLKGIDIVPAGTAQGSVLTSRKGSVELEPGTQMLLVTQAAVSAAGSASTVQ